MAKPSDILPKLMQAYVDATAYAERLSKESFTDIRPDYSEMKKMFEESVPIKHRRDYIWFINDLVEMVSDTLCKHPKESIEGDSEPEMYSKQDCKVCGLHRVGIWIKDTDDGSFTGSETGHYQWSGWYEKN